jgi:hypothetical protein
MKRAILLSIAIGLIFAGSVSAQVYFGVKTGMMMIDVEGVDNIIPIGGVGGYDISSNMSIEGEFNFRVSGGDWEIGSEIVEWKIWTVAGYFVYRFPLGEALYLKGKAGILHEDITAETSHVSVSGSDSGLSLGGGLGMNFNEQFSGEVEFTLIEADINYFSVGVRIIP